MCSGFHLNPGHIQVRCLVTDFVESNWKKVVTLKTDCDNLILCNFSNSISSIDE